MQKAQSWSTICTTRVADHSMALVADLITIMESKSLKADIHFSTTNVDHSTKTNQRLTKLRAKVLKLIFSMIIAIITITTKKSSPSTSFVDQIIKAGHLLTKLRANVSKSSLN